jgi:diaminopimelate decarboxylase
MQRETTLIGNRDLASAGDLAGCQSSTGLAVAGVSADTLAARFGTPLFAYDADLIRQAYRRLSNAIRYFPSRVHYAAVCNPNLAILRLLRDLGAGLHANTPGDVYCGLRAGFSPNEVVFSGSNLGDEDLDYLLDSGIPVNVDSVDDLDRACRHGKAREFGLRVHLEGLLPDSRMGLREWEVRGAEVSARRAHCRIIALHVYCGTHGRAVDRYALALSRLLAIAEDLPDVACLNLGGGFGYDYHNPEGGAFPFEAIGESATEALERFSERTGRRLMLRLEPGRAIVAGAGTLLTRVRSVKRDAAVRYVGVDTTVANFTSPAVHGAHRRVVCVDTRPDVDGVTHVCGATTYSRDFIARDTRLPDVSVGDLLAVLDVGAYGYCMASHFLNRPRPAEVMVDGGEITLITRRESFEDLVTAQLG